MYLLDPALNWAQGQPKDAQLTDTGVVLDLTGGGKSEISIQDVNPSTGGRRRGNVGNYYACEVLIIVVIISLGFK